MGSYYLQHYFDFKNAGKFLAVAFAGLIAVLAIIISIAKTEQALYRRSADAGSESLGSDLRHLKKKPYLIIESFYEMVFSSTSILLFLGLYYIIDEHIPEVATIWHAYQNVFLLIFICMSVVLTAEMDLVLVKLTHLTSEQKSSVRLVSSIYVVLILLYIRFIYNDTNYNELILYFITLAVGRFVFFDFTIQEFREMAGGVARNLPILVLMVLYSAIVCWYGFKVQFLLKSNGVILSTLIAHLFMDLSIFVLHRTKLLRAVL